MNAVLLPPGFEEETKRTLHIPRYPYDPLRVGTHDAYVVSMAWMLYINESIQEDQLRVVTAWLATLGSWLTKLEPAAKVVAGSRITALKAVRGESTAYVKEFILPSDEVYSFWKGQAAWVKVMHETLGRIVSTLQTFNANRRQEYPLQS